MAIDLQKSAQTLRVTLAKAGVADLPTADFAFLLDVSGSFDDEHREGITDTLLERLVPWGMVFDPDEKLDVFTFSNGRANAHYAGVVTPANCEGYVRKNIIRKVPGYNGGTDYSHVIEKALAHFGWKPDDKEEPKRKRPGLVNPNPQEHIDREFVCVEAYVRRLSIVALVTDGSNDDQAKTEQVLKDSQKRHDGVFFILLGVSNQTARFPFLDKLAKQFDNVHFVPVDHVRTWVQQDDATLNKALIAQKLIEWLKP